MTLALSNLYASSVMLPIINDGTSLFLDGIVVINFFFSDQCLGPAVIGAHCWCVPACTPVNICTFFCFFVCVLFDVVSFILLFGDVNEKKTGLLKHAQIKFYITITSIFSDLKQNRNILCGFRSCVVYMFVCAGCNACYIGETTRHFSHPYAVNI